MGMVPLTPIVVLLLTSPLLIQGDDLDHLAWSRHTYKDESYILNCETDTVSLSFSDVITWSRHGEDTPLANNDHFELRYKAGIPNAQLFVKKVTDDTKGIYICNIREGASQVLLDSVVYGINVGGTHKYHKGIDKYRENIIVGTIAAACIFGFIIIIGLISHFRYLSEESLEKRRQRKEDRLRKKYNRNGVQNAGADIGQNNANGPSNTEDAFARL